MVITKATPFGRRSTNRRILKISELFSKVRGLSQHQVHYSRCYISKRVSGTSGLHTGELGDLTKLRL